MNYVPRARELMLKKCPFCGEHPNLLEINKAWVIECKDMGCIFKRSRQYKDIDALIERWNKRSVL